MAKKKNYIDDFEDEFFEDEFLRENAKGGKEKIIDEEGLEFLKNLITENYNPASKHDANVIYLSTKEFFSTLISHYPCVDFTQQILVAWLRELGYTSTDMGGSTGVRIMWAIKKN